MTESEGRPATLASGFDFARRQRDPEFRKYLRDIGWTSDRHVVIVSDDEPVATVAARIINNDASSPCLIAIPDSDARFGFGFMFMEVTHAPTRRGWRRPRGRSQAASAEIVVKPGTSMGMLYSSGRPCAEYVPSAWTYPVVFTHVKSPG
ncbi:hypothetical protein [Plantactinospora sp. KBS50]|uniref:hypothetical protein n=1 Tax=Plantactinospora sp. KBS50 TaxID=2024580 RepID=UPI000BAABBC5|nr:hypothetical protein [Plantactinospora sp. KBS50]ASW53886.1 hypothetical protein CIK06_06340 [Plantactinospora sp. KBS50]